MSEDKKPESETSRTPWKHDQELSFNRVTGHLETLKDAVENALNYERAKLARMVGTKDLVKK